MDDTTTLKANGAQGPAPNRPRQGSQIPRSPSPPLAPIAAGAFTTKEFLRALRRRHGQAFRRAETARAAQTQFRVRCKRAVLLIARKGVDTNVACRAVGLCESTTAQNTVKALCDARGIARRYWWGYPRWKSQVSTSVSVRRRRKEIVRRDDDEEENR
jgi:hypothetical protein